MDEEDRQLALIRDLAVTCKCKVVKHRIIRLAIERGAQSVEDLRRQTGANTGCGKLCLGAIEDMLAKYGRQKG